VAFEVVAVALSKNAIAVALAFVPLSFVDVLIRINHSAFTLWHPCNPVSIVSISVLVEECASAMFLIFKPVSSILSTELSRLITPVSSLTVAFISLPESLVLVAVLVELNAKTVLLVIFPVAYVAR